MILGKIFLKPLLKVMSSILIQNEMSTFNETNPAFLV